MGCVRDLVAIVLFVISILTSFFLFQSDQEPGRVGASSSSGGLGGSSSVCADDSTTPIPPSYLPSSSSPCLPTTPSPIPPPPATSHSVGDDRSIGPTE